MLIRHGQLRHYWHIIAQVRVKGVSAGTEIMMCTIETHASPLNDIER